MRAIAPCDLHTHTYYSDGVASPEALIRKAAEIGLETIAITDHDNTRGSREVEALARELGLTLVTGIEFNTRWAGYGWPEWGGVVDLLGYFVDWDNPEFIALEAQMLAHYLDQVREMCAIAQKRGLPVSFEEIEATQPRYPSVYDMVSVLQRKGFFAQEADYESMLRQVVDCWVVVCNLKFPISRVIDVIHRAGGAAVLAHPTYIFRPGGGWINQNDLAQLVEMGLDGIEIYHYRLPDEATRRYFRDLARPFDLAITGGSDEHARPDGFYRLGQQPVTHEMVANLKSRCRMSAA
jgi:predicted metal-dependent phosphoesterase TrpH